MILHVPITDETLQRILSYGDLSLSDLTDEDLAKIKERAERSLIGRIVDEPHYAYEDFVDGLEL